jgi:hypothetical protein
LEEKLIMFRPKNIPNGVKDVALGKYFSHPSLIIYLFCNPTHKTKTANRLGIINKLGIHKNPKKDQSLKSSYGRQKRKAKERPRDV